MPRPVEGLCLCLLLCNATVYAEEPAPDPEVLDFLGEWATDDGGWLDPESLLEATELDDDQVVKGDADGHEDAE